MPNDLLLSEHNLKEAATPQIIVSLKSSLNLSPITEMLISLRSDHKDHLNLLTSQPTQVIVDFCKLAIDFLQNGPNIKLYKTAADKLSVELDSVQNSVYGLVNLLLLSCKHKLSEVDFRDSVLTLGFNQEQQTVLSKFYETKRDEVHRIIAKLSINEPRYENLEWRFEVQVSSRSLLHQVTPLIVIDLNLKNSTSVGDINNNHLLLQTDITNLLHITQELDKALIESKSRHSRKIQRALNN